MEERQDCPRAVLLRYGEEVNEVHQGVVTTVETFNLDTVTIGRWEGATKAEGWLFRDNQAFMKQMGSAQ